MRVRFGVIRAVALLLLLAVVLVVSAVRVMDHLYARRVETRYVQWEESVERDEHGVRREFAPLIAGEGDVGILFVHGFAGSPSLYRYFVPYFTERGFACRAIRLPGFGEVVDRAAEVRREDWVRAVRTAAEEMREAHDALWIVAHSLGATLTLRVLQEDPSLADGVILLAPLVEVSEERSPLLAPDEWFAFGEWLLLESRMLESAFPIDAHDPQVREKDERDLFIPLSLYAELFALLDDLDAHAVTLDIPVMMVLSTRDKIVDPHAAKHWFSAWGHERNRLLLVEPAGHVIPLDTGWEDVLREIEAFIAEREE